MSLFTKEKTYSITLTLFMYTRIIRLYECEFWSRVHKNTTLSSSASEKYCSKNTIRVGVGCDIVEFCWRFVYTKAGVWRIIKRKHFIFHIIILHIHTHTRIICYDILAPHTILYTFNFIYYYKHSRHLLMTKTLTRRFVVLLCNIVWRGTRKTTMSLSLSLFYRFFFITAGRETLAFHYYAT